MRSISSIFFCLLSVYTALAVNAPPYPVTVKQPDGSTVTLIIRGDEFFHYFQTADGRTVSMDKDGFFRASAALSTAEATAIRERNIRRLGISEIVSASEPATEGPISILIIPVQFSDVVFSVQNPREHFNNMLNSPGYSENGGTGSALDYFRENVPNRTFRFDVAETVTLSQPQSYYGENDVSTPSVITYDINIDEMVKEACSLADNSVDFSTYDNDKDGYVDYVFLFFAGYNEAESGNEYSLWPQTSSIKSQSIRVDGVSIGVFSCSSELSGSDLGMDIIPAGIGTFCHEFSHFLGLVDLYDTNHGNDGVSKCLWGSLSLMDTGNYNNYGRTPPYFCAIDRELAGSASYIETTPGTTTVLSPISENGNVLRIPTAKSGEYYLVENRTNTGWDAYIGGSGMLIYHIDKSDNIVNGITASMRWKTNLINTCSSHECADLVEAFPNAEHISQVFFPGQADITEFSAAGDPAFITWDGTPVGIKFMNIAHNGNAVTFDIMEDNTEILLTPYGLHVKPYQNKAIAEWNSGRPGTYKWGVMLEAADLPSSTVHDTTLVSKYTFEGLTPRTDYTCRIFHISESHNGDTVTVNFSTSSLTSPYPYIALDRTYSTGDTLNLVINNLTEEVSSCIWYINGTRAITDSFVVKHSGTYDIKATLRYVSDGSEENIERTITVKDSSTSDET